MSVDSARIARSISKIILTNTAAFHVKSKKKKKRMLYFQMVTPLKLAQLDGRIVAKREWTVLH